MFAGRRLDALRIHLAFLDGQPPEPGGDPAGQRNGLCAAAVPGVRWLVAGLHTGEVPLVVEWHDAGGDELPSRHQPPWASTASGHAAPRRAVDQERDDQDRPRGHLLDADAAAARRRPADRSRTVRHAPLRPGPVHRGVRRLRPGRCDRRAEGGAQPALIRRAAELAAATNSDRPPDVAFVSQLMKGMSSAGMVTKGRIMSRSSCSRMWQWYMYLPLYVVKRTAISTISPGLTRTVSFRPRSLSSIVWSSSSSMSRSSLIVAARSRSPMPSSGI